MSDVKKRIVKFFLTGNSFILFCARFFSGISSKRKSAFWWIYGIVLAHFHHQSAAVLPSMRFERGERSQFDSSCASKKTCKSCRSESEEAEGEGPFCAPASRFFTPVPRLVRSADTSADRTCQPELHHRHFHCPAFHQRTRLYKGVITSYCSVRSTTAPTWLIPSVLERLRDGLLHLRLQPSLPSHPNRCGGWKSPAYEPKHFATSKTSVWLHLGPRRHQPHSQQARNDLTPPSLETRRPLPAMLETAFPAAIMASLLPPTMAFEPRANFKNMSSTTSAK